MALAPVNRAVTIDRHNFILILWQRPLVGPAYKNVGEWPIAVGAKGHTTPSGLYWVEKKAKAKFPAWTMPHSDWVAPELRGTVVPGKHPDNPIKSRWIGLTDDGVGIHGTADDESIGTRASHGCIRMHVADVEDLYEDVRAGMPVFIC